jgi:hypothetical protein
MVFSFAVEIRTAKLRNAGQMLYILTQLGAVFKTVPMQMR